jgi:hypothetical protein
MNRTQKIVKRPAMPKKMKDGILSGMMTGGILGALGTALFMGGKSQPKCKNCEQPLRKKEDEKRGRHTANVCIVLLKSRVKLLETRISDGRNILNGISPFRHPTPVLPAKSKATTKTAAMKSRKVKK